MHSPAPSADSLSSRALIKGFYTTPSKDVLAADQNAAPWPSQGKTPVRSPVPFPSSAAATPTAVRRPLEPIVIRASAPSSSSSKAQQQQHQQQQPQPQPQQQPHPQQPQGTYELFFPAGPMGLELEPVITSSERQLGCRVKDFYFGLDHCGVDPLMLQERVTVGDVISHVDGVCVLSLRFTEVLELLRAMRGRQRVVVFKNISASWSPPAGPPLSPAPPLAGPARAPFLSTAPADLESYTTVHPATPAKAPSAHLAHLGPAAHAAHAAHAASTSLTLSPKAVRDLSRLARTAPPAPPQTPQPPPVDLQRVLSNVQTSLSTLPSALPIYSTLHVDSLVSRKHMLLHELSQSCMQLGRAEHTNQALQSELDAARAESLEAKRELVGCREEIQAQRDELSLARCGLTDALAAIESLQSELQIVSAHRAATTLSVTCADAETRAAHEATQRERDLKEAALRNAEEYRAFVAELQGQLGHSTQALAAAEEGARLHRAEAEREAAARRTDQDEFAAQLARLHDEQRATRGDIAAEFAAATERLAALEHERDCLAAECDVLRDMSGSDRAAAEAECARLRQSLVAQSEWHRHYALGKEEELEAAQADVRTAQQTADALLRKGEEALRSLGDEHETRQSLQQRLEEACMELRMSEERLGSAGFEFACVCEERAQLLERAEAAEAQLGAASDGLATCQAALAKAQSEAAALTAREQQLRQEVLQVRDEADTSALQARACRDALQHKDALLQACEAALLVDRQAVADTQRALAEAKAEVSAAACTAQQRELEQAAALARAESQGQSLLLDAQHRLGASEVEVQCHVAEVAVLRDEMAKLTASIEHARLRADERLRVAEAESRGREEVLTRMMEEQQLQSAQVVAALQLAAAAAQDRDDNLTAELQSSRDAADRLQQDMSAAHLRHIRAVEASAEERAAGEARVLALQQQMSASEQALAEALAAAATQAHEAATLRGGVAAACRRMQADCSSLRAELGLSRSLVWSLGQHNTSLMEAFAQAEREKGSMQEEQAALAAEQNERAQLQERALEAALAEAQAALLRSEQHEMRHHDASQQLQQQRERCAAAEAALSLALTAQSEQALTLDAHATEAQALRTYCEEQRAQCLALEEQHVHAALETASLRDQLRAREASEREAAAALAECRASLAAASQEAHDRSTDCAVLRQQLQTLRDGAEQAEASRHALAAEMTAERAANEARLSDQSDRHCVAVEAFRAERARILSSYEHMLEESRRCSLRAATQQHEQYQSQLAAATANASAEMQRRHDDELARLHESLFRAQDELEQERARAEAVTAEKTQVARQGLSLEAQLQTLAADKAESQQAANASAQRCLELQAELAESTRALTRAEQDKARLETFSKSTLADFKDKYMRALKSTNEEKKVLEERLAAMAQSSEQRQVLSAVSTRTAMEELEATAASLQEQRDGAHSREHEAQRRLAALEHSLRDDQQRIAGLEESLRNSRLEASETADRLRETETALAAARAFAAQSIAGPEEEASRARQSLQAAEAAGAESRALLAEARRDVLELGAALAALLAQLGIAPPGASGAPRSAEPDSYQQQRQEARRAVESIAQEGANMRSRAAEMEHSLRALEAREEQQHERRARLEMAAAEAQSRAHAANSRADQAARESLAAETAAHAAEDRAHTLDAHVQELSRLLAESRGEVLHTRQALLNARAELGALQGQVSELLQASLTPAKYPMHTSTAAPPLPMPQALSEYHHDDGDGDDGAENDENQENADPALLQAQRAGSVAAPSGLCSLASQSSHVLQSLQPSRMRTKASQQQQLQQQQHQQQRQQQQQERLPLQPRAPESHREDQDEVEFYDPREHEHDVSADDDAEGGGWHDRLLALTLDLHEAIVFSFVERATLDRGAAAAGGQSAPPAALLEASSALQLLHEHCLAAPWLTDVSAASALPSLPPAHQVAAQLDSGALLPEPHTRGAPRSSSSSSSASASAALLRCSQSSQESDATSRSLPGWMALAASAQQQARREEELWEARARAETLSLQLTLETAAAAAAAPAAPAPAALAASVGALSLPAQPHRVVMLLGELLELVEGDAAGSLRLPALPSSERCLYQTVVRLLREVVCQYRLQLSVLSQQLRARGGAGRQARRDGESVEMRCLVEGDSFDSVNTGERDESAFWDVSASIED